MSHGAPKESSVSLESGYSSNSDLRLRANSQLDNQKHRSNEAVVDQEGALTSGSSRVENHPEEKYDVEGHSLPVSPHLGGRGTSRDFTPRLSDDRDSPLPSSQQQSTDDHESSVNQIYSEEEARQKLEVIAGKSMEMMASNKREVSNIRRGWTDQSGHVEELEQIFSAFMVSLDAFNLKVQQEQSKSASSDTNSRSHTEHGVTREPNVLRSYSPVSSLHAGREIEDGPMKQDCTSSMNVGYVREDLTKEELATIAHNLNPIKGSILSSRLHKDLTVWDDVTQRYPHASSEELILRILERWFENIAPSSVNRQTLAVVCDNIGQKRLAHSIANKVYT